MRRIGLLAAVVVAAWLGLPGVALAAPQVIASEPEEGAELQQAPDEVSVTFDLPLDPNESELIVTDECGRKIDDGNVTVAGNRMSVGIARTPAGTYSILYRAVPPAEATGASSGQIDFEVIRGVSCGKPVAHAHHGGDGGGDGSGHSGGHGDHGGHGNHPAPGGSGSTHDHGAEGSHADHSAHESHAGGSSAEHDHSNHTSEASRSTRPGDGRATAPESDPPIAARDLRPELPDVEPGVAVIALALSALLGLVGGYVVLASRA